MLKLSRAVVAAIVFAGAGAAVAQPPGPGGPGRPGGFEKKDFPRREAGERKDGERPPAEALERELQMLRARIAEVESQLKKKPREDGGNAKRPEPKREGNAPPQARGPGGPGGMPPMGPGGFGPGRGGPGFPGGPMGPGGIGGGPAFTGPGMHLPLENMSAEQIKQLIGRLQQALEAKGRSGEQPRKPEGNKGDQPKKPEGNRSGNEDVMKRLERIQKELEDIRRSIGK